CVCALRLYEKIWRKFEEHVYCLSNAEKNPWRGCQGEKCHNLHFRRYISPVTVSSQGKWHHTGQLMKLFKGEGHPYPVPVVVGL
ncbi:TPA: hypothetical protein ACNEFQ_004921, partial [Escherichia coli]